MFVPLPLGWKYSISRIRRNVCRRPFLGGMKSSTSSLKSRSPTLSLLLIALNARIEATSAASSRLLSSTLPNVPEALTSTTSITVSSRSSVNFFT